MKKLGLVTVMLLLSLPLAGCGIDEAGNLVLFNPGNTKLSPKYRLAQAYILTKACTGSLVAAKRAGTLNDNDSRMAGMVGEAALQALARWEVAINEGDLNAVQLESLAMDLIRELQAWELRAQKAKEAPK